VTSSRVPVDSRPSAPGSRLASRGPSRAVFALAAVVIVFQLACPLVIAGQGSHLAAGAFATQSDAARYRAIAETGGTPYRDFQVEYPPLALGVFRALGPHDFGGFRQRLLALQVACQILIVSVLFKVWAKRAAWSYLVLSTPMLFVIYPGFDLVGVALAVGAAALVHRKRPTAGAVGFVVGAFTKLWPVVLLPALLVRRQMRAAGIGIVTGLAGLVAWSAWGGAGAIGQVVSYRGARGWEYESLPGSILRLFTRDTLRFSSGSWRVGLPPGIITAIITVMLIAVVGGVWWLAAHRPDLPEGIAETAAVTSVLVFGTLLSPQFLIWPLPFVAIAAAAGATRVERWAGAAAALTFLDWIVFDPRHPALLQSEIVILCRNAALVGLLVVALTELRRAAPDRRSTVVV